MATAGRGRAPGRKDTDALFLAFKNLRPYVDRETRALNDATVRDLVAAVIRARTGGRRQT